MHASCAINATVHALLQSRVLIPAETEMTLLKRPSPRDGQKRMTKQLEAGSKGPRARVSAQLTRARGEAPSNQLRFLAGRPRAPRERGRDVRDSENPLTILNSFSCAPLSPFFFLPAAPMVQGVSHGRFLSWGGPWDPPVSPCHSAAVSGATGPLKKSTFPEPSAV